MLGLGHKAETRALTLDQVEPRETTDQITIDFRHVPARRFQRHVRQHLPARDQEGLRLVNKGEHWDL